MDSDDERKPRGFGRAFVDLFRELGYDEGDLQADTFEWLFGLPSMRIQAFLDWFLTSIRPRQCVKRQLASAPDYAIYTAILRGKVGSHGLLIGDQLTQAELACQSDVAMQTARQEDSLDSLLAENATLEQEIQAMEHKLRLANDRNDRLAKHVQRRTLHTDNQRQRVTREKDTDHFNELLMQIAPSHSSNGSSGGLPVSPDALLAKIRAIMGHLSTPMDHHHGAMDQQNSSHGSSALITTSLSVSSSSALAMSGNESRKWRDFLYQHRMDQLEVLEQNNLRALQAKIPAISALSSLSAKSTTTQHHQFPHNDETDDVCMSPVRTTKRRQGQAQTDLMPSSPWLHESDSAMMDLREQDALIYNKCCVELERLRQAFVVGERDALIAQLQVTRYECHLKQLTNSRHQLLQQFQLMSRDTMWARKQILQASLDKTKRQLGEIMRHALPQKLEELAFLKSTSILLHSYEQKLWRQENRFLKLKMLLEGFEMQHARLRLVHRLLDAERQDLLTVDRLFQQLVSSLRRLNHATEQRITSYDTTGPGGGGGAAASAAHDMHSQATYLDEQDGVAHHLFQIVEEHVHNSGFSSGEHQQPPGGHGFRFRSFDELVRLCEFQQSSEKNFRDQLAQIHGEWERLYDSKRTTLDQLRKGLFGDATSSTPMLLPVQVVEAVRQANEAKDTTEHALESALETLRIQKRSVQVDAAKQMQQDKDFARLKRELAERV